MLIRAGVVGGVIDESFAARSGKRTSARRARDRRWRTVCRRHGGALVEALVESGGAHGETGGAEVRIWASAAGVYQAWISSGLSSPTEHHMGDIPAGRAQIGELAAGVVPSLRPGLAPKFPTTTMTVPAKVTVVKLFVQRQLQDPDAVGGLGSLSVKVPPAVGPPDVVAEHRRCAGSPGRHRRHPRIRWRDLPRCGRRGSGDRCDQGLYPSAGGPGDGSVGRSPAGGLRCGTPGRTGVAAL